MNDQANLLVELIFFVLQTLLGVSLSIGQMFFLAFIFWLVLLCEILEEIVGTRIATVFWTVVGGVPGHQHAKTVHVSEDI